MCIRKKEVMFIAGTKRLIEYYSIKSTVREDESTRHLYSTISSYIAFIFYLLKILPSLIFNYSNF